MKKRGISLIVLIVTIIVIIILAAVVILTISKNNPIEIAKEATFKEDVRTFQDELAMYIAKDYINKAGQRDDKITATNYSDAGDPASVYMYIPSFSKKYEGKFVIRNDEIMYNEEKLTKYELKWSEDLNLKLNQKTGAEKAKEEPQKYYGAIVDYKTGNTTIDNDITEWKIFYSDGCNVYIISSEYLTPAYLPKKDGYKPEPGNETDYPKAASFNNTLLLKYNGSSDITDEKMKAFNRDYFDKNYTSRNNNMKAVAYMLDKDIWSDFANASVSEYAVGGPSVEMLMNSYSQKNNGDFRAKANSYRGYFISNNGGISYSNYISEMFNTSDNLYVLSEQFEASKMWIASPSDYQADSGCVVTVVKNGYVFGSNYSDVSCRFPSSSLLKLKHFIKVE